MSHLSLLLQDISHVLFTILFYEFPMFGPTKDWFPTGTSSRLISLVIVAHFATIYQLFFLHVAISFNRLTAIFWPFHHRVVGWSAPATPCVIFCMIFLTDLSPHFLLISLIVGGNLSGDYILAFQ
jgi:hypothetical protein